MTTVYIDEYRQAKKREKRGFKMPTFVIYLLLIIVGLYFFLHSPIFNIKNIEIIGNNLLEKEKILDLSQVNYQQNLITLKKDQASQRILVHPLAKEVTIERKLPNTLIINIEERKPVGLLVCQDGFIQVSEDGYFLSLLRSINHYQIPVITGINMDYLPGPGQKIQNEGLLTVLDIIKQGDAQMLQYLAEINMENSQHVLFYTIDGTEIRLGSLDNMDLKLNNLKLILFELLNKELDSKKVEYIDLRFSGPPIIRKKI